METRITNGNKIYYAVIFVNQTSLLLSTSVASHSCTFGNAMEQGKQSIALPTIPFEKTNGANLPYRPIYVIPRKANSFYPLMNSSVCTRIHNSNGRVQDIGQRMCITDQGKGCQARPGGSLATQPPQSYAQPGYTHSTATLKFCI